MQEAKTNAGGALSVLNAFCNGFNPATTTVERVPFLIDCVLDATGCEFKVERGIQRVIFQGVEQDVRKNNVSDETYNQINKNIRKWLENDIQKMEYSPVIMSGGGKKIIERMGISPAKVFVLLESMYSITYTSLNHALYVKNTQRNISVTYIHKSGLMWKDGLVSLKHKTLPDTVNDYLKGKPISKVLDNRIIGDSIIRKVCKVSPTEKILRIVTFEEGKTEYLVGT